MPAYRESVDIRLYNYVHIVAIMRRKEARAEVMA